MGLLDLFCQEFIILCWAKMKKIFIWLLLLVSIFLVSCGNTKEQSYQQVKVNNLVFQIPEKFVLVASDKKKINKFEILQEYKLSTFSGFADSLIIWKYIGEYPVSEEKFFSIIMDKFIRKIPWAATIDNGEFKKKDAKVFWFKYSVKDNLFNDSKPDYYGLQAYIFDKKQVYVINYLSSKKDNIDQILDLLKKVEVY